MLGLDIHYLSISYLGWLQVYIDTVSHLDFGYFDLVNPVDQVNHASQGSDSKIQHGLYLFQMLPVDVHNVSRESFERLSPDRGE